MSKGKLAKFADMETYPNVFQYPYAACKGEPSATEGAPAAGPPAPLPCPMRGQWRQLYFHNQNPIILELGCGRGEYAVELAKANPQRNYIGVDIKGARMWTGATQALREGIPNVAFLRTNIEIIDHFFAPGEVQQLWLTFSDPQMKNPRKRLTSTFFLERYRRFLQDRGIIHLKTDSQFLFTYTTALVEHNRLPLLARTDDLYATALEAPTLRDGEAEAAAIQTYYEDMWLQRGLSIKYMQFLLPHDAPLSEPDVEIELDDYRSYHRSKRSPLLTRK